MSGVGAMPLKPALVLEQQDTFFLNYKLINHVPCKFRDVTSEYSLPLLFAFIYMAEFISQMRPVIDA